MKKIAIVRRNGLGDLLCAYPLVRYFQKNEPSAHLTLFVDPRNAPLLPYLTPVDRVVIFPKGGNKYLSLWKTARQFYQEFDLALSAKTSPMKLMNFFLFALGAKERVAYVDDSWHSRFVNAPQFYDCGMKRHQALKTLRMVAPDLQEVPEEFYPKIEIPCLGRRAALPSPLLLLSVTNNRETSQLNYKRYATLLNRLHRETRISVLVIGEEKDRACAEALVDLLDSPHQLHFPRNFDEFMLLLNQADCYFVGDGGVGHLGAALGKKGVILFGVTSPIEWGPLSKKMETLYHPTHVDNIEDEAIFQALKRMICGREDRVNCVGTGSC